MNQQIFFMAGLPRSGNTLLSTILNQNPDIYSSPQSPLIHAMGLTYNLYYEIDNLDVNRDADISNILDVIPKAFYKGHSQKYVIDKSFRWSDDIPFALLQRHLKNPIKIICPVRDVLEVLASFNNLAEKDVNNSKDIDVVKGDFSNLSLADKRAKYWMENPLSDLVTALRGMKKACSPELSHMFHFVEYNDLVSSPEETVKQIYEFLEIEQFEHTFKDLKTPFTFNDSFGFKDHHKIRPSITRESHDPKAVFSQEIVKKYSGLEFWRNI